jgi:hypothetical protein
MAHHAAPVAKVGAGNTAPQVLDHVAVKSLPAQHHLQAVVLGRVVAARHRYATRGAEFVRGEIAHRCRHATDVDHVGSGVGDAGRERSRQFGAREPSVAADDNGVDAARHRFRAEGEADLAHHVGGERAAHDAANVVGLEDFGCGSEHGV